MGSLASPWKLRRQLVASE